MRDFEEYDGLGLAGLVSRKEVSPEELLDAAVDRAHRIQPRLNCLSQFFPERARTAIAGGLPDGPFRGVPFLLKDVSVTLAGTPTLSGSRLCRDAPPAQQSSTLVERFECSGAVIFGKTTTPEFGIAASTETSLTGITRNPWNPE